MVTPVSQSVHPEVLKPAPAKANKQAAAAWAFGEFGSRPEINLAASLAGQVMASTLSQQIVSATVDLSERQMEQMRQDREDHANASRERARVARKPKPMVKLPQTIQKAQTPHWITESTPATSEHGPQNFSRPDRYDPNTWKFYVILVTTRA